MEVHNNKYKNIKKHCQLKYTLGYKKQLRVRKYELGRTVCK